MRSEGEGAACGARTSLHPSPAQSFTRLPAEQSDSWLLAGRVVPQLQARVMTRGIEWQAPIGTKVFEYFMGLDLKIS